MQMANTSLSDMTAENNPVCKNTAHEDNIYNVLRTMNGLSMTELAQYLHTTANRICRLEQGLGVRFIVIQSYSELFGVPVDALIQNNLAAVAAAKSLRIHSARGNKHKTKALAHIDIGELGEEIVAGVERELLSGTGFETCVSTKPSRNPRNGYDVISATEDGQPKYIEVKTTTSTNPDEPFYMSDAEYRKMKDFLLTGAAYELYRVYALNAETMDYRYVVYTPQEVLDLFEPIPETYRMVRKGGNA